MEDGGWNCDREDGSTRGSFNTTINVLEGLLEFERVNGSTVEVTQARERGHEFLLKRKLYRRLSTGEPITQDRKGGPPFTQFSFPTGWHYDILRALEYFRRADISHDPRMDEAIEIIRSSQNEDGLWLFGYVSDEEPIAEPGPVRGNPSYWITLRAMRVLEWYKS